MMLTADGSLHLVNLVDSASTHICSVELPEIPPNADEGHFGAPSHRLHASFDGSYVAVVVDRGRHGIVVDTRAGSTTMKVDGGDYYEETVPFSACFVRAGRGDVFVHRTGWNRLDVSDPATGKSRTNRDIAPYEATGSRPDHYLDYFHGQLLASPGGALLFDDGWVWHPVSIPRIWSIAEWLGSNSWESEDGASVVDLGMRDDWSQPACWINDELIAVWGATTWDEESSEESQSGPGLRLFGICQAKLVTHDWWPLPNLESTRHLLSDGQRLYVATANGTTVLDTSSREPVAEYPGFAARLLDRTRRTLLAFSSDEIHELAIS